MDQNLALLLFACLSVCCLTRAILAIRDMVELYQLEYDLLNLVFVILAFVFLVFFLIGALLQ